LPENRASSDSLSGTSILLSLAVREMSPDIRYDPKRA